MSPLHYQIMESFLGWTEGADHALIAEVGRYARMGSWDPRRTPWCDIILDGAFALAGMPYTPSRMARSWHTDDPEWGVKITRVADLRKGDVVVLATQPIPNGHVGLLEEVTPSGLRILGGNQSNAVNVTTYKTNLFVAGFRPTVQPDPRTAFFNCVRAEPFPGNLTQGQVDGLNAILAYFDGWPDQDLRRFAYVLATVFHETAATMRPVMEYGSQEYLRAKAYWPWIGRGLVQLTWEANYRKMGGLIGVNLIADPEKANDPDIAIRILFEGMYRAESGIGDFTNKSLEDYFTASQADPINARRIVNGTDKAELIAGYYEAFLTALQAAKRVADYVGVTEPEPAPEPLPEPVPTPSPNPTPIPLPIPIDPPGEPLSPDQRVNRCLPAEFIRTLRIESEIPGMSGGYFEAKYRRTDLRFVQPGAPSAVTNVTAINPPKMENGMEKTKSPLESLGVMGPLTGFIVFAINWYLGAETIGSEEVHSVVEAVSALWITVTGIYGRWRAKTQIA